MSDWQPTTSLEILKRRAAIVQDIRQFFAQRQVLEVDTPTLAHGTVTDVHLQGFATLFHHPMSPDAETLYLQTSPEYAMKRLLCAGSGSIFQICKAFRDEEAGRYHNPEFTMLEWYRIGFDHMALIAETDTLLQQILGCEAADRVTYQETFITHLGLDPLCADIEALRQVCIDCGHRDLVAEETDRDTMLHLLFSHHIEPRIGTKRPVVVFNFPASQAALARLDPDDPRVARRFEFYYRGIELANGFHELTDVQEQTRRFASDNALRKSMGLPDKPLDERFVAALHHGLPDCAGVALGLDRLIMLATGADKIDQVINFPINIA